MSEIRYHFPPTKFVQENDLGTQLLHVQSEVGEIELAAMADDVPVEHLEMEIVDLYHSLETYFRVMERIKGRVYVLGLFRLVEEKNRARGYYHD